jgi:cobalt-zinc-cadmium efflux system protein
MDHDHELPLEGLQFAILLTGAFMLIELVGGYLSGSLALVSDGVHMFRDLFSLVLSWTAIRLSKRLPTETRTFGYHRTEIFAAFVNGNLLLIAGVAIIYSALVRMAQPVEIQALPMLSIALAGLFVNLFILFKLKSHDDLNVKSAYLHVLWDTVSSVAVILGAGIIYFTGLSFFDTGLSVVIALATVYSSIGLIVESLNILLLGTPRGIKVDDVIEEMKRVPGVLDVHGVHLWALCSNINVIDAHIHSRETTLSQACRIVNQLNQRLERFNIKHTTFQFECDRCPVGKLKHLKH